MSVAQVLQYSAQMHASVGRLRLTGCRETQISFRHPGDAGYNNPSAPVDGSCDVFNASGGGVVFQDPPRDTWQTIATPSQPGHQNYGFTGSGVVTGIGSTAHELIMWFLTTKDVCDAIAKRTGAPVAEDTFPDGQIGERFTGAYGATNFVLGDNAYASRQATGCFSRSAHNQYIYYHVLLTR